MTRPLEIRTLDLKATSNDNVTSIESHFEAVVKQATEVLRGNLEETEDPGKLITHVGEYLVQAAQTWSRLTDDLIQAQHINRVVTDTHERSRSHNHLCDLSSVVQIDIELSKLK